MNKKHIPLNAMEYPRFEGIRTFMRLPHTTNLNNVDFLVAGIPFDTELHFESALDLDLLELEKTLFY